MTEKEKNPRIVTRFSAEEWQALDDLRHKQRGTFQTIGERLWRDWAAKSEGSKENSDLTPTRTKLQTGTITGPHELPAVLGPAKRVLLSGNQLAIGLLELAIRAGEAVIAAQRRPDKRKTDQPEKIAELRRSTGSGKSGGGGHHSGPGRGGAY